MMFGRRRENDQLIAKMERQLDLIHTALVVRDPGTSVSANAYEGLRKQIIAAATARQAHVAQLAEFDVALHRGASTDDLRALVAQWLAQAGVARVDDPAIRDAFDSTVPAGVPADVEIPAYVTTITNQLVRQGRLRARKSSAKGEPGKVETDVPRAVEAEADKDAGADVEAMEGN